MKRIVKALVSRWATWATANLSRGSRFLRGRRWFDVTRVENVRGLPIRLSISSETELWRALTYSTKEPETLEWIESFEPDDVLWDIGANVGLYSLFAAARHGVAFRVLSFEPDPFNFAQLCKNVFLNKLDQRIEAFPVALSHRVGVSELGLQSMLAGAARQEFAATGRTSTRDGLYRQRVVVLTLDELREGYHLPVPTHLKLDTDGAELDILAGASAVLSGASLRSVLVEVDEKVAGRVESVLGQFGFSVTARHPHSAMANYIFQRF